jgi:hypothetical protein
VIHRGRRPSRWWHGDPGGRAGPRARAPDIERALARVRARNALHSRTTPRWPALASRGVAFDAERPYTLGKLRCGLGGAWRRLSAVCGWAPTSARLDALHQSGTGMGYSVPHRRVARA